jgi:hypothetical protein
MVTVGGERMVDRVWWGCAIRSTRSEAITVDAFIDSNHSTKHEQSKRLSRLGGLEAIDLLGKRDLSDFRGITAGRAIWAGFSVATGGRFDSRQHRRRGGTKHDGGIHSVPGNRAGIVGRSGDIACACGRTGTSPRALDLRGDRKSHHHSQDAFSLDQITASIVNGEWHGNHHAPLTIHHSPSTTPLLRLRHVHRFDLDGSTRGVNRNLCRRAVLALGHHSLFAVHINGRCVAGDDPG